MAESKKPRRGDSDAAAPGKLYTLSEVSKRTGISMPTLQRYKKLYQARIPSTGKGRKQRYPDSSFPVFEEIKQENLGKRGRPRKDASAAPRRGRKPAAGRGAAKAAPVLKSTRGRKAAKAPAGAAAPASRSAKGGKGLLTLTQVSQRTKISYPTLVRYVKLYSDRLPHEGIGRARRFYPEAVEVFVQLRQESGRGGRKKGSGGVLAAGREALGGAVSSRIKAIEAAQKKLEKNFRGLIKNLQKLFK